MERGYAAQEMEYWNDVKEKKTKILLNPT